MCRPMKPVPPMTSTRITKARPATNRTCLVFSPIPTGRRLFLDDGRAAATRNRGDEHDDQHDRDRADRDPDWTGVPRAAAVVDVDVDVGLRRRRRRRLRGGLL